MAMQGGSGVKFRHGSKETEAGVRPENAAGGENKISKGLTDLLELEKLTDCVTIWLLRQEPDSGSRAEYDYDQQLVA